MGRVSRWDVPLNTWVGVRLGEGLDARVSTAISRWSEDMQDDSAEMAPELANRVFGIPGEYGLKFDTPISIQRAAAMHDRKKKELDRLAYMEAASHRTASGKALAGFGASVVGNMMSPLDFALNFVPFVGQGSKASGVAKLGRVARVRAAVARGLIPEEAFAKRMLFPEFSARVVDATLGNAISEVPVFIQKQRDQAVYGLEDSLINVAAGGLFGGTLHLSLKGIARALSAAGELHARLSPQGKNFATVKAIDDVLHSRPIEVDDIVRLDEAAIEAKVDADLRAEAEAAPFSDLDLESGLHTKGSQPIALTPIDKLLREARHPREIDLRVGDILAGRGGAAHEVVGVFHRENRDDISGEKIDDRTKITLRDTKTGEVFEDDYKTVQGDIFTRSVKIEHRTLAGQLHAVAQREATGRIDAERQQRIQDYIAKHKPERIAAERQRQIAQQQAQGKIPSDEEVTRLVAADEEKAFAAINEDVTTLTKDIEAANQRLLEDTEDPKVRERLKKELDEQMAAADSYQSMDKAIQAALPCVTNG